MTKHLSPEERRDEIRQAALRCFVRAGYAATRMDDVAAEAGLSKGAVYWHFESKQALFADLVSEWFGRSQRVFADAYGAARGTPKARLQEAVRRLARDYISRREEMPLLLDFWSEMLRDEDLRSLHRRIYGGMRATWAAHLGDSPGLAAKERRRARAEAAALVGAVSGLFVQWLASPDEVDLERGLEAIFDLTALALARRTRPRAVSGRGRRGRKSNRGDGVE